jgi:hypothetical protein
VSTRNAALAHPSRTNAKTLRRKSQTSYSKSQFFGVFNLVLLLRWNREYVVYILPDGVKSENVKTSRR